MFKQDIIDDYIQNILRFHGYTQELRGFFVRELAQVLHNNVEHPESPRDKIDWFIAEEFIDNNLTHRDLESVTSNFLYLCAYSELKKTNGNISDIKDSPYVLSDNNEEELLRIRGILLVTLVDQGKHPSSLIDIQELEKEHYKKLFLGRFVWDRFYQKIQDTVVLGKRGYGRVRFS